MLKSIDTLVFHLRSSIFSVWVKTPEETIIIVRRWSLVNECLLDLSIMHRIRRTCFTHHLPRGVHDLGGMLWLSCTSAVTFSNLVFQKPWRLQNLSLRTKR